MEPPQHSDFDSLPDDPAVLRQMIRELLATLHQRDREIDGVRARLDQLLRRLYGPRAERIDPNQPLLFADLVTAAPAPTPPPPGEPVGRHARPHGRRQLPKNLRRVKRVHELSEAERRCPCCGELRRPIGHETSEQLDYEPATLFIIEHRRVKYACAGCQEQVVIAAKPPQPIDKGLPGPGLLAQVIVSKYDDHLPLHRQERIFARQGLVLQRSTTCGWMAACAELLRPLVERMHAQVLRSRVIHTDDSPLPVLDATRDATRQGHMWVYLGDSAHPYTVFDFTPNHTQEGARNFLLGFAGYLQADAYKGYDALYADGQIIEVACWAHARRKFYEAQTSGAARAHQAMAYIRLLYDIEDAAKDLDDSGRQALRQEQALPRLAAFRLWLEQQQAEVLPKSPLGQAIGYTLSNWPALRRYTEAGFLAIDNNMSERTLREFVLGRKNWLFAGNDNGGRTSAMLFTMTTTCRRLKIDAFAYLRDVLRRLPELPATDLDTLLPDRWAATQQRCIPQRDTS
jgi:transposase